MSVLDLKPEEVLQPSRLPEYQKKMRIFWDELVYLHTNLRLLRQVSNLAIIRGAFNRQSPNHKGWKGPQPLF